MSEDVWTAERIDMLKAMWADGHTASIIAAHLGGEITRSAVLGKVHRMNAPGEVKIFKSRVIKGPSRPNVVAPPTKPTRPRTFLAPIKVQPSPRLVKLMEPEPLRLEQGQKITIFHLSISTCRWPIGDLRDEDFCYCGHEPKAGLPYCEFHAEKAYQKPQARSQRS